MSGKGSGKKRNRAAQSEQHGFQQPLSEKAGSDAKGKTGGDRDAGEGQRVREKLKDLEQRRRDREGDQPAR